MAAFECQSRGEIRLLQSTPSDKLTRVGRQCPAVVSNRSGQALVWIISAAMVARIEAPVFIVTPGALNTLVVLPEAMYVVVAP